MKELRVMCHLGAEVICLANLADDGHDILFQYSSEALARNLQLSPLRLPLRVPAYPNHPADYVRLLRLPGLIFDSLPDSWGFHLMNRRLKARGIDTNTLSVLDRLAYLGQNTMGALTYEPADNDTIDRQDFTLLELAQEMQTLLHDESHQVLAELARAGGSPGGARPKALVDYHPGTGQMSTRSAMIAGAEPWLVKFPAKEDASDSCALEELYARLAHKAELGMGPTQYFELAGGLTAFATRRFDRSQGQRVHVHSLAGLLHADFQTPSVGYGEFLRATRTLTHDVREVKKALRYCVFNLLMNNRDDHAKNLAFLLDETRSWQLAPPFDLTYCPGYRGEHFMDVAGEGKQPARSHVLKVAQDAGLSAKESAQIIDQLLDQVSTAEIKSIASTLPIRKAAMLEVNRAIAANRKRLMDSKQANQ